MKARMTKKEFKEALLKIGTDFDEYGYEGVLNFMAIGILALQKDVASRNPESVLIGYYGEQIDTITTILEERKYYK